MSDNEATAAEATAKVEEVQKTVVFKRQLFAPGPEFCNDEDMSLEALENLIKDVKAQANTFQFEDTSLKPGKKTDEPSA